MIISSMHYDHEKHHVYASSTSLLPLAPPTIINILIDRLWSWFGIVRYLPCSRTIAFMQMTLKSSSPFFHSTSTQALLTYKILFSRSLPGWLQIVYLSNHTEFLLTRLKQQLAKMHNSSLNTTKSDRNLGFIFDEYLTFSCEISSHTML